MQSEQGQSICLAGSGDCGMLVAGVGVAVLPSGVWVASGVLTE